ncbi:hypothetical protein [Streptomyces sp. UH6]|uniref:hypothetical protein n=1 Tax=Streptomyces sp. UH6 TaxID=2748379 RepID=UPI0015D4E9FA|nr:hypothetical protein [Streptomyces sp. UH6]NYV73157.1 hypothetical protein [Streptomyces sp. UH6]
MASLHQPEWYQQADRGTQLTDPVLSVRQLSRFEFSLKHTARIQHALVFSTAKGEYVPYLPPERPSRSEIATRRCTALYEVDMGVHSFTEAFTLPSDNDAVEFTVDAQFSWQVVDPVAFVRSGHRNVHTLLLAEFQQTARPEARRFHISDSANAESALVDAVTIAGPLGTTAGLLATWSVRVRRDHASISAAEQIHVAELGLGVDAAQLNRQHQLRMQQERYELERMQLEQKKVEFYQWHLEQGGVHAWALHLAQHPGDSLTVMNSMREDQLRMIRDQMSLVQTLLGGNAAERFELDAPRQLALRTVTDILNQRLPGVAHTPPMLPPNGGGPGAPDAPEAPAAPGALGAPGTQGVPGSPGLSADPRLAHAAGFTAQAAPPGSVPVAVPQPAAPGPDVAAPPAWQPPPGYGSTPTAPSQEQSQQEDH